MFGGGAFNFFLNLDQTGMSYRQINLNFRLSSS